MQELIRLGRAHFERLSRKKASMKIRLRDDAHSDLGQNFLCSLDQRMEQFQQICSATTVQLEVRQPQTTDRIDPDLEIAPTCTFAISLLVPTGEPTPIEHVGSDTLAGAIYIHPDGRMVGDLGNFGRHATDHSSIIQFLNEFADDIGELLCF